jgi:hypothetical protein
MPWRQTRQELGTHFCAAGFLCVMGTSGQRANWRRLQRFVRDWVETHAAAHRSSAFSGRRTFFVSNSIQRLGRVKVGFDARTPSKPRVEETAPDQQQER